MKVVIYFNNVNSIGGVETWLYYLSKKYSFTFYYQKGDPTQIKRLCQNIKVKKYKGEIIECDKFIVNYNPDIIGNVKAKEYIMMIHCDYSAIKWVKPVVLPIFTKYIGVSQYVCDVFEKMTGIKPELCYNPVYIDKPKIEKQKDDKLHLICATRMSGEKGGWRIDKLTELLDKKGIYYDLTLFTNRKFYFKSPNVIIKDPKLDLTEEIVNADYLVQLSDAEAFCYSVIESLTLGTPVIVTDLPVYNELGLNDSNSIKIPLLFDDFDTSKLVEKKFNYKPPKDNWNKYLPANKGYDTTEIVNAEIIVPKLYLVKENKHLVKGNTIDLPIIRATELEAKELINIL